MTGCKIASSADDLLELIFADIHDAHPEGVSIRMRFYFFYFSDDDIVELICCINNIFDLYSSHCEVISYLVI